MDSADLKPGDTIKPGSASNYGRRKPAARVDMTGTLNAAIRGAELAQGGWAREAAERIYIVEPTGPFEDRSF